MSYASTNTKWIARQAGCSVKVVHEVIDDLGLARHYDFTNRHWNVDNTRLARMLVEHLENV